MRVLVVCILVWTTTLAGNLAANHLNEFKREIYSDILDEINDSMQTISDGGWHTDIGSGNDGDLSRRDLVDDEDQPDYREFFSEVLTENEAKSHLREKRFLKSLLDLLKKNKTKPNPHKTDHDFFDTFGDEDEDDPSHHKTTTSKRPIYFSSTTKARPTLSTSRAPSPLPSAAEEDPFYRLKNHCALTYDQLCSGKKTEMHELVKKCDRLKIEHGNQRLEPCREVYSVYCYVFYDRFTCLGQDYDPYVPGRKKFTASSTARPTPQVVWTSTGRYTSGHTIKINVITTNKPNVVTTTRSTTRATTRPVVTTTTSRPTTRPSTKGMVVTTTVRTTPRPGGGGGGGAGANPFPDGPLQIPKSADKLKEIGEFCLKTKAKDQRCDTMLKLLKDKFKTCEKRPKTDTECQTFKVQFCTAYTNFPCCPDVLAGRTCSGKSNSAAKRMMYM